MRSAETTARELIARALQVAAEQVPADAGIDTYEKWDSLNHLRIVEELEKHLGRPLETEEVLAIVDLATLAGVLGSAAR